MKALSFILEATHGCQFSCKGCNVQTRSTNTPSEETRIRLLALMKDLKNNGVDLVEMEVGPADLLSAENGDELLTNPQLLELYNLFNSFTASATFVHANQQVYVELAKKLQKLDERVKIAIAVPLEIEHLYNSKYMHVICTNIRAFYSQLQRPVFRTVFNIIADSRFTSLPNLTKKTMHDLFSRAIEFQEGGLFTDLNPRMDFVFHHGRVGQSDPMARANLAKDIKTLHSCYLREHERKGSDDYPRFLEFDKDNDELLYHNGRLYVRPAINDRAAIIDPEFMYKGPWTSNDLQNHYLERMNANMVLAMDSLKECSDCEHISECSARFIPEVIKYTGVDGCITSVKSYEKQQLNRTGS